MMQPIEFRAPWGKPLRIATWISVVALLGIAAWGIAMSSRLSTVATLIVAVMPLVILLAAIPFGIRGYVLAERAITVKRIGWNTVLSVSDLQAVTGDAQAMQGSLRVFGNGGMFAFSGEFWNRKLGRYRALATDPSRAVVLRYPKRVVVITPHDPQQFIMRTRTLIKTSQFRG